MAKVRCLCGSYGFYVVRDASHWMRKKGIGDEFERGRFQDCDAALVCKRCGRASRSDGRIADPEGRLGKGL